MARERTAAVGERGERTFRSRKADRKKQALRDA
jgi:hypothetical protein